MTAQFIAAFRENLARYSGKWDHRREVAAGAAAAGGIRGKRLSDWESNDKAIAVRRALPFLLMLLLREEVGVLW